MNLLALCTGGAQILHISVHFKITNSRAAAGSFHILPPQQPKPRFDAPPFVYKRLPGPVSNGFPYGWRTLTNNKLFRTITA